MKRFSAILFLLLYMLASTELHQFIRLPILIEHYLEHQLDNPVIRLSEFMVLHYFSGDSKNADYARDQQLPFKSDKCPEVSIAMALPPEDFPISSAQVYSLSRDIVMLKSFFMASSYHFSIWQPPRA